MLIFNYESKKVLKTQIGQSLQYTETSLFGDEYVENGDLTGCNRPYLTGFKREFFARVTIKNGLISKVV